MFEIASKLESLNLSFALVTIVKTKGIVPKIEGGQAACHLSIQK